MTGTHTHTRTHDTTRTLCTQCECEDSSSSSRRRWLNMSSAAHRGCRDAARLTSQQLTLNGNLPEGAGERFSQTDVTRLLGAYTQEKEAPKVNECSARRRKKKKKSCGVCSSFTGTATARHQMHQAPDFHNCLLLRLKSISLISHLLLICLL